MSKAHITSPSNEKAVYINIYIFQYIYINISDVSSLLMPMQPLAALRLGVPCPHVCCLLVSYCMPAF